jgi:integrase
MTKKASTMGVQIIKQSKPDATIYTGDDMRLLNTRLEEKIAENKFTVYRNAKSENTLKRQHIDLASFSDYLSQAGLHRSIDELENNPRSWQGIGRGLIEGFQLWLINSLDDKNAHYAMGTINIRLTTIRQYCRLVCQAGFLSEDELALILAVKGKSDRDVINIDEKRTKQGQPTRRGYKKEAPTHLRTTQVFALKRASQPARKKESHRNHDKLVGARDALLMGLLFEHTLRCGEVRLLDIECFDLESGQMTFYREKTARSKDERETHDLKRHTRKALDDYLGLVATIEHRTTGPLFLGYQGQRISNRAINARVAVLGQEQGVEGNLSPHDARHFWTYDAFRNGTSIDKVMKAGGWKTEAMPLRYAKRAGVANEGVKISEEEE